MYLLFRNFMPPPVLQAVISNPAGVRNPCGDGGLSYPAGRQEHHLHRFLNPGKNAGFRNDGNKSEPANKIS
jgi:hypothetical protein